MRCTQVADRPIPDGRFTCRDWVIAGVIPIDSESLEFHFSRMTNCDDSIRKRALAFAQSGDWHNPIIISDNPADSEIVLQRGTGNATQYRRFRIEMDMRPDVRARAIDLSSDDQKMELERFLNGKWTMDVTCSATDVIAVDFPDIDLP